MKTPREELRTTLAKVREGMKEWPQWMRDGTTMADFEGKNFPHFIVREFVKNILTSPFTYRWSFQGLGMLRCYYGGDKRCRLHIWDPDSANASVSTMHNHPWDFTSYVVAGRIENTIYEILDRDSENTTHKVACIKCGEGGGFADDVVSEYRFERSLSLTYRAGSSYSQRAATFHESRPSKGAVTILDRKFLDDVDHAVVAWPKDEFWVSAEPRRATVDEIIRFTKLALQQIEKEGENVR